MRSKYQQHVQAQKRHLKNRLREAITCQPVIPFLKEFSRLNLLNADGSPSANAHRINCQQAARAMQDEDLEQALFEIGFAEQWKLEHNQRIWRGTRIRDAVLDEAVRRHRLEITPKVSLAYGDSYRYQAPLHLRPLCPSGHKGEPWELFVLFPNPKQKVLQNIGYLWLLFQQHRQITEQQFHRTLRPHVPAHKGLPGCAAVEKVVGKPLHQEEIAAVIAAERSMGRTAKELARFQARQEQIRTHPLYYAPAAYLMMNDIKYPTVTQQEAQKEHTPTLEDTEGATEETDEEAWDGAV